MPNSSQLPEGQTQDLSDGTPDDFASPGYFSDFDIDRVHTESFTVRNHSLGRVQVDLEGVDEDTVKRFYSSVRSPFCLTFLCLPRRSFGVPHVAENTIENQTEYQEGFKTWKTYDNRSIDPFHIH
ncbi:hypothetical protein V5O48_009812 [Marasmius crinis-equi]|uniref:Uncharacterized protein n=1 Tax=Marasmius crinis-equi TaxID=585013 RepID=A0ABR3FAH3_9AGAR